MGDDPAFAFAVGPQAHRLRLRIIGMRLHRKAFTGEYVFDQQLVQFGGWLEPHFADRLVGRMREGGRQAVDTPDLVDELGGQLAHHGFLHRLASPTL